MAANDVQLGTTDNPQDLTRFDKRFSKFVATFVDHFEEKLDQYCKESEGKIQKLSSRGTVLEFLVTAVFTGLGVAVGNAESLGKFGQTSGRLLGKYFGTKHHAGRANTIHANVGLAAAETVKLRATLVETATEIFRVFEMQFMSIESEKGWHKAMQDLAHEAVERIINYSYKSHIRNITSNNITKAFINGPPKLKRSNDPFPHKVMFEGDSCNLSGFYSKAYLRIPGNPDTFYVREKKNKDQAMKFGCRLVLKWEDGALSGFEKFEPKCPVKYNYLLQDEELLDEKMIQILHTINDSDPNFKLDAIYKGLNNWMANILNSLSVVLEELKRSQDTSVEVDSGSRKAGVIFNLQKPVECFIGRDLLLQNDQGGIHHVLQDKDKNKMVNIVGPSGIGKSELARKFAADFKGLYNGNVIWINCSVQCSMITSFRKVAKRLPDNSVSVHDSESVGNDEDMQTIPSFVRQVHAFFADKKCLFIFDDAQELSDIELVLPPISAQNYVLITSRNELCNMGSHTFSLTTFTQDEAMKFLQAKLTAQESLQDEITTIVKTVECSPLSLQLVAACIEEKRSRGVADPTSEILGYLKKHGKGMAEDKKVLRDVVSLSMALIGQEDLGQSALKMLKVLTFFFSENIPCRIFSRLLVDDENSLSHETHDAKSKQILDLLAKYSVITFPSEFCFVLTLHRAVQESIKLSFSEEEYREVLTAALSSLRVGTSEEHVLAVWKSATKHSDLVNTFKSCSFGGEANNILHLLAKNGDEVAMKNLLTAFQDESSKKIFLNSCNKSGNTAVHLAAKNGFIKIVKYLENENADVTIKNNMQRIPFHECIVKGQPHVVRYFAQQLDCSAENEDNLKLVCLAVTSGNIEVLQYFINDKKMIFCKRGARNLPVHEACKGNKQEIVKLLLGMPNADAEACDVDGNTPLHVAAQYGHMQLVKYLIEEKTVEVSPKNKFGKTPAHFAVKSDNVDIVAYLLKKELTMDLLCAKNKYTLWHEAAYNGRLKMLKYFAEDVPSMPSPSYKWPINSPDSYGNTPLHEACSGGDINVVKYLVETLGARVDAVNRHLKLPIHRAAVSGKLSIVKYFLEDQKIAVDVQGKCGSTSLVKCRGTLPETGSTPLHEATYGGCLPIVKLLVEKGADIENRNSFQRTPLFGAVKNKHHEVMTYLVEEKGCKIDVQDSKGKTLLQVAEGKEDHEAVEYLTARLNPT